MGSDDPIVPPVNGRIVASRLRPRDARERRLRPPLHAPRGRPETAAPASSGFMSDHPGCAGRAA